MLTVLVAFNNKEDFSSIFLVLLLGRKSVGCYQACHSSWQVPVAATAKVITLISIKQNIFVFDPAPWWSTVGVRETIVMLHMIYLSLIH